MENQEIKNNVMLNEKEELAVFDDTNKKCYCSKVVETEEDKKALFNALETCDVLLNDIVNQEIDIKDIYVEESQVFDEESGVVKPKYRTIIFDSTGKTYATGSYGIYNVLKKIIKIYGLPTTWENPLKVKVVKRPIKNGKQSLTLSLI